MATRTTNKDNNGAIQKTEEIACSLGFDIQSKQADSFTQSVINYAAIGTGFQPDRIVGMILNDWASNTDRDSQWLREKAATAARDELERDRERRESLMAIATLTSEGG